MQVSSECAEGPDRICISIRWHCHEHLLGADIDARRVRVQNRKHTCARSSRKSSLISHRGSFLPERAAQGYEKCKLPNGIAAIADVTTDLYVISDPRLTTGSECAPVSKRAGLPQAPAHQVSLIPVL